MNRIDRDEIELDLMLDGILKVYGYDFRHYARASLKRRVNNFMSNNKINNCSQLQEKLIHNEKMFNAFLLDLSITVTEMFRDPDFYMAVKKHVFPVLKTYPYIKIWHAGCATGEEVYSMAIFLHEAGLLKKATIYATDFNNLALSTAKEGIYDAKLISQYAKNYKLADGEQELEKYYSSDYGAIKIKESLKKRITWANHNLVTDKVFGEMNVIFCRNVLIYFNSELQDNVFKLFKESLCHRGYLCLGTKETVMHSSVVKDFESIAKSEKIYRKV